MKEIKDIKEMEIIKNYPLAIIVAKTKNCSVCTPVVERLEIIMNEYKDIPLYSIYIDEIEEFRGQYLVFTVPTVLIFSEGKEILRESRFVNFNNIKRLLEIYTN